MGEQCAGENHEDSMCAELLALGWASVWALDFGLLYDSPFVFAFDCTSAGLGTLQSRMAPLPAVVASLRLCLTAQATVTCRHVKSHSGILGNELVDQLAKAAARTQEDMYNRCLPEWPHGFARHPLHPWAWRFFECNDDLPTLFAMPSEAVRLQAAIPMEVAPPTDGQSAVHGDWKNTRAWGPQKWEPQEYSGSMIGVHLLGSAYYH